MLPMLTSSRPNKTQTGKSVSGGYAHPNQRGKVIVPRNLTAPHTKHAGDGVAIDLSFESLPIHDIWAYAITSLESVVPDLVQDWHQDLLDYGYNLQGSSMFLAYGYVLMGYGATAHVDSGDPHFTAGFWVDRLAHERPGDKQLFFPELYHLCSPYPVKRT
ncbi:Protein of unknown function [Pyronema omphalodes CBS 100304]|uniref:Uncharacterized protein n=1 Tax=Pyronema omphalodes (strain CBS 100304) TaxID=1076935 RepID=U4L8S9_PYROM|nr:Protein of unknown function [Pyronema omphalodes CBS 100304]